MLESGIQYQVMQVVPVYRKSLSTKVGVDGKHILTTRHAWVVCDDVSKHVELSYPELPAFAVLLGSRWVIMHEGAPVITREEERPFTRLSELSEDDVKTFGLEERRKWLEEHSVSAVKINLHIPAPVVPPEMIPSTE